MSGRIRTAKKLAQRIERNYFKGTFAIPRWSKYLTLIAAMAGAGWLGWRALARDATVYSSGPVAPHHTSFGNNCAACHIQQTALKSKVTDQACLACHDGPMHKEQQISTPHCIECHIEHKGAELLVHSGGKTCSTCHANLRTKSGKVAIAAHIESLAKGHPEFTPLLTGHSDPGSIKFNHKVHLRKDLKGPNGNVQLECNDCHRPNGIVQPWPYGQQDSSETTRKVVRPASRSPVSERAYMQPINYYEHCSSCHPLTFDEHIKEAAPHKKPEIVIETLRRQFQAYISAHPQELRRLASADRIPRIRSAPEPRTPAEWVRTRMAESERLLWTKTCAECHSLSGVGTLPAPKVREANLTVRWLQHGSFDHSAHKMLACTGCHTKTETSEATSDILVPSVKNCQTCHNPRASNTAVRGECFECHQYHDWSKEKPRHGNLGLPGT